MKITAIICNIVLFLFICLVLVTDGLPKGAVYIIFTLWSLMKPIFSSLVISRIGASDGRLGFHMKKKRLEEQESMGDRPSKSAVMRIAAIVCNIIFLGHFCWAFVDQYPHPKEDGFVAFMVLMTLAPILSMVALYRGKGGRRLAGLS
jgi:hypothetical protein